MTKKILLIEDEPDFRLFLATLLQDNGYQAIVLEDGEDELGAIDEQKPDLVLLDFMMPGRSGLSVCKVIRERWEPDQMPVLLVTGLFQGGGAGLEELEQLFAEHSVPFPEGVIEKPIKPPELIEAVERLTD